jgi:hypothetical protein
MSNAHDHGKDHGTNGGHDAHGHDAHGHHAHGHDAHEAFDPMPTNELSPGEPRSPAWMPVLGLGLFLVGGTWFLASQGGAPTGGSHDHAHDGKAANAIAPNAVAPNAPQLVRAPTAPGGASARPTPPQDAAARKKLIDEAIQKAAAARGAKEPGGAAPAPAAPRTP